MIHFIYGKTGSGKTTAVFAEMARAAEKGKVYLLVPDREAVAAESRAAELANAQNIDVLTFGRLCNYIFRRWGGLCVDYIGAGAKKLIMRNVIKSLAPALREYGKTNHFGVFEKLTEFRSACYHDKIDPSALVEASRIIGDTTPLGAKTADLGLIFSTFDQDVSARFEDPDGMLSSAYALLKEHDFFSGTDVFIDSFSTFSMQQYDILENIFRYADNVTFTFPFVREDKNEPSVAVLAETERRVRTTAQKAGAGRIEETVLRESRRYRSEALRFLAENIERSKSAAWDEDKVPADIRIVRASNSFSEAEAVAQDICRAVRSGVRYREIAVIVRETAPYEGILDAVFRKYEIPYFLSSRKEISEKPLIKLIFSAFSIAERGFRGSDVIAYIKTGYSGITADEVSLFENYIVKWNLRGKAFTDGEPWNMHPRGYGATFTEEDTERLRVLSEIRERVIEPLKAFSAAGKSISTVPERASLLFEFLTALGVPAMLEQKAAEAAARGQAALAAETVQLWKVFCGALDQIVASCGQTEATVSEFSQMLSTVLLETDIGKIPTSVDEVTISGAAQKIPGEHRYVYIVGAEEGKFPMRVGEKGLFSEHEKSLLKTHGVELSDRMERGASEELYYFYRAATLASERLHISFAHYNFSGDEQFPSVGIKRVCALFKGLKTEDFESFDAESRIESKKASFEKSTSVGGNLGRALREYYEADEGYARKMKYMKTPLGAQGCALSEENAELLFPGRLSASYSRLEKFIKCRFSYFCEYELKLRDYDPASFGAPDIGSFMHGVLEKTVQWIADGGEGDIGENIRHIAGEYVSEIFHMPPELVPKRLAHLFDYLCRSAEVFAKRIKAEFEVSSFRPRDFELTIGREGDAVEPLRLESGEVSVELRGKIDRVDTYEDGDGRLFVRVVDYKTGTKTFSLENVKLGLDTQMLLYLFSIWENGEKRYGADPVPAAVLYAGIKPPQVDMKVGEDTAAFEGELETSGLFLKNEDVLRAMEPMLEGRYIPVKEKNLADGKSVSGAALIGEGAFADLKQEVTDVILKYAAELKKGVACAKPLENKKISSPCEYCKMKAVCRASRQ
ncbi:MAG: exodeoxyribonuclease V subunit gamma [Clostridia bacterium]|nr:exodeoxyribonuclease V subunit gamma [Clostridia bacterium]